MINRDLPILTMLPSLDIWHPMYMHTAIHLLPQPVMTYAIAGPELPRLDP